MENFDIIGGLQEYADSKGWDFVYTFDKFYANAEIQKQYDNGELVLTADFKANPTVRNGRVTQIEYTCLLMLGRKFDPDGTAANLDETSIQKYDRRLKELVNLLANGMADFACLNDLDVVALPIAADINVYDTNIDFAISNNAIFRQG